MMDKQKQPNFAIVTETLHFQILLNYNQLFKHAESIIYINSLSEERLIRRPEPDCQAAGSAIGSDSHHLYWEHGLRVYSELQERRRRWLRPGCPRLWQNLFRKALV